MNYVSTLRTLALPLAVGLFAACDKDQCDQPFGPVAPAGYTITALAPVIAGGAPLDEVGAIQMVDAATGFALRTDDEARELYKTTDGGSTWAATPIPFALGIESAVFTDATSGVVSHRGGDTRPTLMKTTDGGATWTRIDVAGIDYAFSDLRADDAGHLYARAAGYGTAAVAKSTDGGLTWSEIYASDGLFVSALTIAGDRIYFKEANDRLVVLDLDGGLVRVSAVGGSREIVVMDADNVVVVGDRAVRKTADGGATWTEIFGGEARVVDFSAEGGLLLLVNRDYCGDDSSELSAFALGAADSDVVAVGNEMKEFEVLSLASVHALGAGRFLLQSGDGLFVLEEG